MSAPTDRDKFLIELYRLYPAAPPDKFYDAALGLLKETVPFDSALWGTFALTPEGPVLHQGHVHRIEPRMLEDYERIKHLDLLNQQVVAKPGRTVNMSLARAAKRAHPAALAHARRWGMEHTLATVVEEAELNLFTLVSLYRSDARSPYGERERRFTQAIVPHLVAAWHMNAIHLLDSVAAAPRPHSRARALIDRHGVIHNAESALPALLRAEIPSWRGPVVPGPLLELTDGRSTRWQGKAIVASLLRTLDLGMFLVCVRSRSAVDSLAPREREVAREVAAGRSHSEIASAFGTSPATVRSQVRSIYQKLGVATRVELLRQIDEAS